MHCIIILIMVGTWITSLPTDFLLLSPVREPALEVLCCCAPWLIPIPPPALNTPLAAPAPAATLGERIFARDGPP